jgi:MSHA biogenesis protein MshQ
MNQLIKWIFIVSLFCFSSEGLAYWSCAWPHKTAVTVQEITGNTLSDYQVKLFVTGVNLDAAYSWTSDGFDFRVIDSDDETVMNYWVEDWDQLNQTATVWVLFNTLTANSSRDIYLYYGNEFADTVANVPFTFTEPGIKFHTRNTTADPDTLSEAFANFDAAPDTTPGYGCGFITDFTNVNNSSIFGAGSDFTAYSETYFEVKASEVGTWGVRYGSDFGDGGGLYVNGITLEEDWLSDLWWELDWNHADVLQGTINLTEGYHKLEVIGSEGCCDGGITVQFQKPGDSFTTYSTANIDIVSRACPVTEPTVTFGSHSTATCPSPIAQYQLDESSWSSAGDVSDAYGASGGTMLGVMSNVSNSQVCSGVVVANNSSSAVINALQTTVDVDADIGNVGSIAFWIKTKLDWNSGTNRTLFDASLDNTEGGSDKYFFLEKLSNGRLEFRFEDSNDSDYTLTESSSPNRVAGTWYHVTVTWDMPNDAYEIFVADVSVASDSISTNNTLNDLTNLHVGDNASTLYTIASGDSANASFDEVTIYNSVLSASEIRGLMAVTRSCATTTKYCASTFPDGIATISTRTIDFGFNAQLLNNPDTQLSAASIAINGGSTNFSCDSAECTTGDVDVNAVSPGTFQRPNASNDFHVGFLGSGTIGDTTNEYGDVELDFLSTLNVDGSTYSEFFIDHLDIGSFATVNLAAGTYWIRDLTVGFNSTINVIGGVARLYVNRQPSWSSSTLVNSPSTGNSGSPENLLMYFYSSISFGSSTTYTGSLYSAQNLLMNSSSSFFGLITARNVTLNSEAKVSFDEHAYTGLSDISWCEIPTATLGSIGIVAASTGINCLASAVDISIYDTDGVIISDYEDTLNLTTNVNHGDWSNDGSANGALNLGAADSGSASYGMLASDSGVASLYLSNTHPELTTINIETQGITKTANINFQTAGFVFSSVPTQISGKQSAAISLQAVETDLVTGACAPLLLSTQTVKMAIECLSPTNCGSALGSVDGANVSTNVSGTVSAYADVSLNFGSSLDSDASFNFNYDNAGSLKLWAQFELLLDNGTGSGNYISGSSNEFVVAPAGFCIEFSDTNWPCSVPGLTASCSAFKQAGDNFTVDVSAKIYDVLNNYCSVASTTNFSGDVNIAHALVAPTVASGGDAGTLSVSSATLSNGAASFTANISDMGVYTLSAGGNAYLGVTLPINASENIGRFYPKDFFIQSSTPATYSDANGSFTYTGQLEISTDGAIGYTLEPSINFVARGFSNQTLKNYLSPLATTPTVTTAALSGQLGSLGTALSVSAGFSVGVFTGPDASGEFTYTFSSNDHFSFVRDTNSLIAPFINDVSIQITALTESTDGVALNNGPVLVSGSGGWIYYGRLNIQNAYGPETASITQRWEMQYFDGTSFLLNTFDNVTPYNTADIGVISVTDVGDIGDPLLIIDSTPSVAAGAVGFFSAGLLNVVWSPTLNGHFGSYLFSVSTETWLQYDWSGSGNIDPQGTVTFGQFRGHDRVIYWKEINY